MNLAEKARQAGINYYTVRERIYKLGWSEERALTEPVKPRTKFPGLREKAEKAGLNYNTVRNRITKYGWSEEVALKVPADPDKRSGFIYKITQGSTGKIYVGLTTVSLDHRWEWHKHSFMYGDVSEDSIHAAMRETGFDDFTIEEIDSAPTITALKAKEKHWIEKLDCIHPNGFNKTCGGSVGLRVGTNISKKAREAGMNRYTVRIRIARGWTQEQALTTPPQKRTYLPELDGLGPKTKEAGVNYYSAKRRVLLGQSQEEAIASLLTRRQESLNVGA